MKKLKVKLEKTFFPPEIAQYISQETYTSSGANAETFSSGEFFIKTAAAGKLKREAELTEWFYSAGVSPKVVAYLSTDEHDYLVTRTLGGFDDGINPLFIAQPQKLVTAHARYLRRLHSLDPESCPFKGVTARELRHAKKTYNTDDVQYGKYKPYAGFADPLEAYVEILRLEHCLCEDVVVHGDYCLPNVIYDRELNPVGAVDVGEGGVGDRHFDIFWALWSIAHNLGTWEWNDLFLDEYGRELIDPDRMRLMEAINAF